MSLGPVGDLSPRTDPEAYSAIVNMSYFMLRHYYHLHGLGQDRVHWQKAELFQLDSFETICQNLQADPPDILGLSVFLWNETLQNRIADWCHTNLPNTIIVMGGPQLVAHKDDTWLNKHPSVHYVVYGDGEKAFQQIIDWHLGLLPDRSTWVNIVAHENQQQKTYPFEQLTDAEYFSSSPFLWQRDFVLAHINDLISRGVSRDHISIGLEFSRGCMYACSFCDWSQNLTKKVKRRRYDWRQEIDFWKSQDICIRETDANFGQWDEDKEIYDYALSLYEPGGNFKFMVYNTSKLKKNVEHFVINNARHYGGRVRLALQDIDTDVLRKMDRPSLTWEEHKAMIRRIQSQPDIDPKMISVSLMLGAAGQTFDGLCNTLCELWDNGVYNYQLNWWMLLPNSPAADSFYQRLHGLEWMRVFYIYRHPAVVGYELNDLYQAMKQDWPIKKHFIESTHAMYRTKTMSFQDLMAMHILYEDLKAFKITNPDYYKIQDLQPLMQQWKQIAQAEAQHQWQLNQLLIQEHKFAVLGRYIPHTKTLTKWFT
jgi:hypothetical protein